MSLRLEPRATTSRRAVLLAPLTAVLAALLLAGFLIAAAGVNPLSAYAIMAEAAFGGRNATIETLLKVAPLILTGLGAAIAFRVRFWNIGGEGQLLVGAMAAAFIGTQVLPGPTYLPAMILAGTIAGAIAGLVPAWLRLRLNVSDTVSTLMLNFIILSSSPKFGQ